MREPDDRWQVETTSEFDTWWDALSPAEVDDVGVVIELLSLRGPSLGYPFSSKIRGSRLGGLRELRIQHRGKPYRVLYAFDSRRVAMLLVGGNKAGDDRWYRRSVAKAEALFQHHLNELREE